MFEQPSVFLGFFRSGSLQEGVNLANLHPNWSNLSQHGAKVDDLESQHGQLASKLSQHEAKVGGFEVVLRGVGCC